MVSNKIPPYSAETQQLLKVKGLKCVCELCDCGRHHRHEGCTKSTDKIKKVFERAGLKDVSTDYQSSYKLQPCHFVRSIRKPLPKLRNPNPPPMDFRTVTNTEFVPHENFPGRPKPCKLEDNYDTSNETFDGKTSYSTAFIDRGQPAQVKLTRPTTVATKQPTYAFSGETTHNATFGAKKAPRTMTFTELPSFAGSLLFPDDGKTAHLRTQNQESYQGKYAPKSDFCGPREAAIKIGTEGDYEHETVHRATYKKHEENVKRSPKSRKPVLKVAERAKFDATTQAQRDFPSYSKKGGFPAPAKPCPPYPATINLAVDSSRDFTTTNKALYKGQWDVDFVRGKAKDEPYTPPKEKFHDTTRTMEDFTPKEITRVSFKKPAENIAPNKLKLSDETSYKTQYPRYKKTLPFIRYGDFHEQAFYIKPVEKFDEQGGSVTTHDFKQPEGFRPRTNYKPKEEMDNNKGEATKESVYRSTYKQKEAQECTYIKYLNERKERNIPKVATK